MADLFISGNSANLTKNSSVTISTQGAITLQSFKQTDDGIYYIVVKDGHQNMTRLDLYNLPPLTSDVEKKLFMNLYPRLIDDLMNVMGSKKSYSIHDIAMTCIRRVLNESSSTSK
jgi:hypothetical protein